VKLFDPLPRKKGTSLAEFSHYWMTHHAELVKEFRRITRYVQSVRLEHKPRALGPPLGETWCDGCAETWHADVSSVDEMAGDPLFPELMDDETRFIDRAHPRYLLKTEERLLDEHEFDPRIRGVKVLLFVRRSPSATRREFTTAWTDDAGATSSRRLGATRHVVCSAVGQVESMSAEDGYDGVRELWWPSMPALGEGLAREPRAAAALLRPDTIDVARSFALVARERVIVP